MLVRLILILLLIPSLLACKEEPIPIPPPAPNASQEKGVVAVYRTDKTGNMGLALAADSLPLIAPEAKGIQIKINAEKSFQEMEGFGAALTESSAYVLQEHLTAEQRQQILQELFSPENGIGISYLRITIGASDFSLSDYTYNDAPTGGNDVLMQEFDLARERQYLIPTLKEILAIAPELRIMATPWTAPAWMKTNQSLTNGGRLKAEYYEAYARYFVRYLSEMAAEGIEIASLSTQNEPLHQAAYPSMNMTAEEQLRFIRDHLGPALDSAQIATKIILYDHNWDDVSFALNILADTTAKSYVGGTAFHCYAGRVDAMSQVHQAHPNKGIFFTECSGGAWANDFGANLAWNVENLFVGAPRNWAKTILLWNLALDQNHGPQNGGCTDCRGVITVNSNTANITRNVEYYLLGHIASFLRPGACRIESPSVRGLGISQVAFQNKDESIALVAYNHLERAVEVEVLLSETEAFQYTLEAGMLATFYW